MLFALRSRLTFANVVSCLALFVALGGSGYAAIKLPRNSVGSSQLRTHSVGSTELRTGAVSSRSIRDGTIKVADISSAAQAALHGGVGPQGPPGAPAQTFRAAVPSGGTVAAGNALRATHVGGTNEYDVEFAQDVSGCVPVASLAVVRSGGTTEQPDAGRITVQPTGATVVVHTFAADGSQAERPFDLVVAC
jgi:hypothetical protein